MSARWAVRCFATGAMARSLFITTARSLTTPRAASGDCFACERVRRRGARLCQESQPDSSAGARGRAQFLSACAVMKPEGRRPTCERLHRLDGCGLQDKPGGFLHARVTVIGSEKNRVRAQPARPRAAL